MSIISAKNNISDTFYLLDLDSTIVDSDKLLEQFITLARQYVDLSVEQMSRIDTDIKQAGESFDAASYVRSRVVKGSSLTQWRQLKKQYVRETSASEVLLPGAMELFEFLGSTGCHYGILTYGNPEWQHLKLSATALGDVPYLVTARREKGKLIASWQGADGVFALPEEYGGERAASVCLVDDKAISFKGFPGRPSYGCHVVRPGELLPSQRGEVPLNVVRARSLYDVVELL